MAELKTKKAIEVAGDVLNNNIDGITSSTGANSVVFRKDYEEPSVADDNKQEFGFFAIINEIIKVIQNFFSQQNIDNSADQSIDDNNIIQQRAPYANTAKAKEFKIDRNKNLGTVLGEYQNSLNAIGVGYSQNTSSSARGYSYSTINKSVAMYGANATTDCLGQTRSNFELAMQLMTFYDKDGNKVNLTQEQANKAMLDIFTLNYNTKALQKMTDRLGGVIGTPNISFKENPKEIENKLKDALKDRDFIVILESHPKYKSDHIVMATLDANGNVIILECKGKGGVMRVQTSEEWTIRKNRESPSNSTFSFIDSQGAGIEWAEKNLGYSTVNPKQQEVQQENKEPEKENKDTEMAKKQEENKPEAKKPETNISIG